MAHEKHIDFQLSTNVSSLCLWLDRDKTEKIFFNLISNAFNYTPAGKSICIEVHPQDKEVQIVVADQGIGIESGQQKTLFQRFETFAHYNTGTPSSGIGLSLVKEMVQMHHGHVEVVSEVGKGSRFIVSLPLDKSVYEHDTKAEFILNDSESSVDPAEEPCEQEEQNDRTADEEKSDDCLSVLVVEDNEELRQFLFNILSGTYRVLEAVNGEQGLTLALEHIPDIIISDVMIITGLTPVEFVREVRLKRAVQLMDSDGYTVSQIAYMTGFSDPKYFGRCFKKMMGMTPTEYKERKGMEN